jgi:flagellin
MAFYGGSRINTNIGARNAFDSLNKINSQIGQTQLKLATGKRINSVSDDAAGYTLSNKIDTRSRSLQKAVGNIGEAKNILATAESGFQAINDILLQVKEKVIQAGNASYATDERTALSSEVQQLGSEIDRIVAETKFNGIQLLNDDGLSSATFQVGADSGDSITFALTADVQAADLNVGTATIPTSSSSAAIGTSIGSIDTAISAVTADLQKLGSYVNRLDFKEQVVSSAITNLEAASSRIKDADVAAEQLESTKLQILQQTATTQLSQANSAPQNILSLFR